MNTSKLRWTCFLLSVIGVVAILAYRLVSPTAMQVAREADRRADAMYDSYCEASFEEAQKASSDYVDYLEAHKDQLGEYRDVDGMLFGGYLMKGYLALHAGDDRRAYEHLNSAYEYHRRDRLAQDFELVPREEFVDFAVQSIEKIEFKYAIPWKGESGIDTNVLEAVKGKFRSGFTKK